ncbi:MULTISPECIES: TolC family protein [Cycloclasticus]|uniref:Aconitate hydratase 1 n=1 Tax=Cycloclasticus pugetii TaxID=34068 RepID=A0AB33Z009_9GAMM|nr:MULTISPECIES: TolC family protein [Cycloclasticus]ATI03221.1 TolC family protein [Cycloclasticus sp. PY97N]EPD12660.1 aconitate hydratase 1 [Cycloclasticus pugetii]
MRFTSINGCRTLYLSAVFLISGLSPHLAYADTNTDLTLKKAIAQTLEQNPRLYQYSFVKDDYSAQRQTQSLRPVIELGLEVENFAGSGELRGFDSAEATLSLSSVIEMGGKRQARMSLVDARLAGVQWLQQAATLDVLGKLTQVYINGLASQENIALANEALDLSRSLFQTIKSSAKRGVTPEAEVMRAQVAVTQAEIRLAALLSKFERQKVSLASFWGEMNPQFIKLTGNLFEFGTSESFEQLYTRIKKSPAIEVFASEQRIKDAEVTLARTNEKSDITWQAGVRRFKESDDAALTAGFSIPLFSNKRNQGEVKVALARRNAVEYARLDALLQLHTKLFEAYSLRQQNIEAVDQTQNTSIPALEKALNLTRQGYENGRYSYLDLITAQEELLATKQALIDAATNGLVSQALIEQLTSEAFAQKRILKKHSQLIPPRANHIGNHNE